jgi:phage gp36-like protein
MYISEEELFAVMSDRDLFDLTDNIQPEAKSQLLEMVNEDAVGIIHGYLRGRYELPIASPDAFFKGLLKDIMKFLLYKRRDMLNVPDTVLKQHATTLGTLKDIQKGTMLLDAQLANVGGGQNASSTTILYANRPDFKTGIF